MKQKVAPQSRKNDIVVQDLNGEVLIYDLKLNKAFCLNETSALVWQACDGNKSVDEISQAVSKKMNQPANEDLVWLALDQLKKENLLENSEDIVSNFDGMSRREVIKKVGLGTMIALPVISGLVAPTAIAAQSGCVQPVNCAAPFVGAPCCPLGSGSTCQATSGGGFMCSAPGPIAPASCSAATVGRTCTSPVGSTCKTTSGGGFACS